IAEHTIPPNSEYVLGLVVAMNIMHVFTDFIPSILVGAPHPDNYLSALPGHKLVLEGHGLDAMRYAIAGCLFGTVIACLLIPVYVQLAEQFATKWHAFVAPVLLLSLILLVASERGLDKKAWAIAVILLSGALGFFCLTHYPDALFPLVTGFFGIPTILFALQNTALPVQQTALTPLDWKKILPVCALGSVAGSLVTYFPALSPSHAAFLATTIRRMDPRSFLCLLGSLNASATLYSFIALAVLNKARTGSAATLAHVHPLVPADIGIVVGITLFCAGIAGYATLALTQKALVASRAFNPRHAGIALLGFLLLLVGLWNGATGIAICVVASAIGCIPSIVNIRRSHLMAFLIAPTLSYYIHL
ncbi:MAG: tripartite tricarboxylate transporter permease, partial [Candidatus Diapherotrites archaeon]|nr:tripartite tricarboxylate transporter permease [Candidatus Diapherotrites archaeon]